jgi:hypothetical protein
VQAAAGAACETVKVLPATVAVPLRRLAVVFAATANPTDPDPVRPVPFWNVRNPLALIAVQAQPVWVVTRTVPLVAAAEVLTLAGLIA